MMRHKIDPYTRWIEEHREQLQRLEDQWIALHPDEGIVFHAADGDAFDRWFDSVPDDERTHLMIIHASMYA